MMRARKYVKPIARLTVFIGVLFAVLLYVDYRVAKASVMEKLLGIGQRMAPFMDDLHGTERPREVHMNGVRLGSRPVTAIMLRRRFAAGTPSATPARAP